MMNMLDTLKQGMGASVGVTGAQYQTYKDDLSKAIQKAKSAQPYTAYVTSSAMPLSPTMPQSTANLPAQDIYSMKVPAPKPKM